MIAKRITSIFYGIMMVFVLSTCNQKREVTNTLRQFIGTKVVIPDNIFPKVYNNTLPDLSHLHRPLKMIVYFDQQGCEDCKLRNLLPLEVFIKECHLFDNLGFLILLNPSNPKISDFFLEQLFYGRTIFFDLDGSFEHLNPHVPKDQRFHTFLLNEENRVVLAGNPVGNAKLKKLYFAELAKKVKEMHARP